MSRVYGVEIARRNRRYDRGVGVTKLDRPVISVGNLSAGGTGKTPIVQWICRTLLEHGRSPAIAMRGYKSGPDGVSDEQVEHAEALPDVPIVAQPDRLAGLRALFATEAGRGVDCVVLDDGFQHRKIARCFDIVLVDATRPAHKDALIPRGFLREGIDSLGRADALVLTRCESVTSVQADLSVGALRPSLRPAVPVLRARHGWGAVRVFTGADDVTTVAPEALRGRAMFASCAIGNPGAFLRSVEAAGARLAGRLVLRDHAVMGRDVADRIEREALACHAEGVVVTAKDWVKLRSGWAPRGSLPVYVPEVSVSLDTPDNLVGPMLKALKGDS